MSDELEILCGKINNRKTKNILAFSVNSLLINLKTKKQFMEKTYQFYDTFLLNTKKYFFVKPN